MSGGLPAAARVVDGGTSSAPRRLDLAADLRFQLFAIVSAMSVIHHELQFFLEQQSVGPLTEYMERWTRVNPSIPWPTSVGLSFHLANVVLSLAVIVFRWRRELLCLLAVPIVLSNLTVPARVSSHSSLLVAASLVMLLLYLAELVERRRGSLSTDWQRWTVIGLCSLLALTYAFAALHKMNPAYFTPTSSGAVRILQGVVAGFPAVRDVAIQVLSYPMIVGGLFCELVLAFVLFVPRLRLYGCLLGLLFHLPMMGQGIMDFPVLVMAFYPLFLSLDELQAIVARLRARPSMGRLVSSLLVSAFGMVVLRGARQDSSLYSPTAPGLDMTLVSLHNLAVHLTLVLVIYVTVTFAGFLVSRSTSTASRAASAQTARPSVART